MRLNLLLLQILPYIHLSAVIPARDCFGDISCSTYLRLFLPSYHSHSHELLFNLVQPELVELGISFLTSTFHVFACFSERKFLLLRPLLIL